MNVIRGLRERFSSVTEDIGNRSVAGMSSTSCSTIMYLRGLPFSLLKTHQSKGGLGLNTRRQRAESDVLLVGGAELLLHYQEAWNAIHEDNRLVAKGAQVGSTSRK